MHVEKILGNTIQKENETLELILLYYKWTFIPTMAILPPVTLIFALSELNLASTFFRPLFAVLPESSWTRVPFAIYLGMTFPVEAFWGLFTLQAVFLYVYSTSTWLRHMRYIIVK